MAQLRAVGLRVTATRLAVLVALAHRSHVDTDSVIGEVRRELGAASPQAVYNVLSAFVEAGIARRIEPAGSVALYELRVGDNHHHVVCRACGAIQDVDCAVGQRPCLTPSDTHGYVLDEAEVTYWGICPACQGPPPSSSPSPRHLGTAGDAPTPDQPRRSGPARREATPNRSTTPARREATPARREATPARREATPNRSTTPNQEEDRRVRQ